MTDPDLLQAAINLWGEWYLSQYKSPPFKPSKFWREEMNFHDNWLMRRDRDDWRILNSDGEPESAIYTSYLIIGWAHDELVRRGYKVVTWSDDVFDVELYPLRGVQADWTLKFQAKSCPTLPHAYLAAIKATEDTKCTD